jgi:hypothetical protein
MASRTIKPMGSRVGVFSVFSVFFLLLGLVVTVQTPGRAQAATGWRDTGFTLPNDAGYCIDATQPNTLIYNDSANGGGVFAYNWVTGQRTQLNSYKATVCNQSNGLLYAAKDPNNLTEKGIVFSSREPQGRETQFLPSVMTRDSTLQTYHVAYDVDSATGRLYASNDGGLTWEERGQQLGGKIREVIVAEADARVLYARTVDNADTAAPIKYEIYASSDAGVSWEKRYEKIVPRVALGPQLYLDTMPGRTAPVGVVEMYISEGAGSNGSTTTLVSTDGARTFTEVGRDGRDGFVRVYYSNDGLVRFKLTNYTYGIDLSNDGGKTWQNLTLPFTLPQMDVGTRYNSALFEPVRNAPNTFLAHQQKDGDLWLTSNSGRTWEKIGPNMDNMTLLTTPYSPLSVLALKDRKLYALELASADKTQTSAAPTNNAPGSFYFPPTRHNLSGVFKQYWEANGGLAQFGYPWTEPFREFNPADGKVYLVQYFERNRFEYHPEYKGTKYEVLLGLLGNQLTETRRNNGEGAFKRFEDMKYPGGVYFPETGHNLRNSFKTYWEANGGLAIYGYPISEEFQEVNPDDGKTYVVQYFERNRFEYHPENTGTRYEVLLGLLGNTVLKQKGWL